MTTMFQSLDFLVLSCLFLTVESQQGQILPPQNVSLIWINGFQPQLSWASPQQSVKNCKYDGFSKTTKIYSIQKYKGVSNPWQLCILMEGGFLQLSVQTVCHEKHSDPAVVSIFNPVLVKNLQCYIHSAKKTHCSWLPTNHAPDLRFFYRLVDDDFSQSAYTKCTSLHIQECSSYQYTNNVSTGCDLEADIHQSIHILFNGTLNNTLARNTFKKELIKDVRPPPLKWTVTKTGDKFFISWTPPNIKAFWTFTINYTECNEAKIIQAKDGETSAVLDQVSHCPYRMAIKAETTGGETPWSDEKYFDADTDPYALVYAAVIIPLMFAGLAVLTFVCCRKNKEKIFPKVPKPRNLVSDIFDNNNKCTVRNLYIPAEEEENCKITLVVDSQINKLDF